MYRRMPTYFSRKQINSTKLWDCYAEFIESCRLGLALVKPISEITDINAKCHVNENNNIIRVRITNSNNNRVRVNEWSQKSWLRVSEKHGLFNCSNIFVKGKITGCSDLVRHRTNTGSSNQLRQTSEKTIFKTIRSIFSYQRHSWRRRYQRINESGSSWLSSVVLFTKKDGSILYRFCVDYRKLNHLTKKCSISLPRIDDTLGVLSSFELF